ncbi:NAD-dependent aldehyde dehydrogenase [Frankia torreyi]|uniref:NAD-dependent aldehyde dehydrogenase n=2 Tax=Frankia TaxID=1854 RepID=A0A0D8BED4_9ACTN|nr:aldehyde dehydrogenase family protein [Frankia torreyi]KJE21742.1 NAD-dependent aldehyde dehydrogenase [Frankia torreyi]
MTVVQELPAVLSATTSVPHYRMFIDGRWVDTEEHYEIINPATEEIVATAAKGGIEHADAAVAAAKRTFDEGVWRGVSPARRAEIFDAVASALTARAEELAVLGTREGGSPYLLSMGFNAGQPISNLGYFARLLRGYEFETPGPLVGPILMGGLIRREPLGVCVAIVPWNFPLSLAVWKVVPALAAGNSVVLKTDEKTPIGALEFARELRAAGLPDGVFNVVTGNGEEVGAHLAKHPDVRKIAFTGSTEVGKLVSQAASTSNLKRVTLELGGKGPNIVLEDADMRLAVDGSIWAFLMHAGQACEAGTRLLLPAAVHDQFVDRLIDRLRTIRIGDPLDPATNIGPLISARQRDRVLGYIESAKQEGATIAHGGGVPAGFDRGYWVEPTVLTGVTNEMKVAREEIFGPVLCVLKYDSVDEAISLANDTEYGLSAGVWSADPNKALEVARRLEAGSVWINDWHMVHEEYPFGGYKQSGLGRELGAHALDEYTEVKSVQISLEPNISNHAFGLVLSTPAPSWED